MRFGLADLDELPSLKEFEQLAQAALGADDGIAPTEPDEAFAEQGSGTNADMAAPPLLESLVSSTESELIPEPPAPVKASEPSANPEGPESSDDETHGKAAGA